MNSRISKKLDWNKMLGFEQIVEARDSLRDEGTTQLGAKVGEKVGEKVGVKIGQKIGQKIGTKVGLKA